MLFNKDEFAQQIGDAAQHVPDLRLRRPAAAAPRRQLSTPQGQGRQGLRQLRPLLRQRPEEQRPRARAVAAGAEHAVLRRHHRRADQRHHQPQHHRPRDPARPAADLHRRVAGRLRHAARRQLGPRRVLHGPHREGLHRGPAAACCRPRSFVVDNLRQRAPRLPGVHRRTEPAHGRPLEHDGQLRLERAEGQLRPRLRGRRRVQHVVDPAGRAGRVRRGRLPLRQARSRIARTC